MRKVKGIHCILTLLIAVMTLSAAYALTPERRKARYYYTEGALRQAQGDDPAAYELFKKAYETDPTYSEAASALGTKRLTVLTDTMQSVTELRRSLQMMQRYVDEYPEDLYESIYYGFVAGQLDQLPEAVRVLERAYSLHPSATNVLLQLSDAYARNHQLHKSIESISRYELQEGLDQQITTRKVSYMLADHDTIGALAEVRRLVDSAPMDPNHHILRGNLFDILQRPDSALKCYLEAERLDPESGAPKLALAGYYHQQGDSVAYDNKMYEVLLTDDLDLDQKVDLTAQYLQTLFVNKHDTGRGDHLFSVLRDRYPHEPRVLDLAARYSAAKGDFNDAVEEISYAIDRDPQNTVYWGQLMTYLAAEKKFDNALDTYERATEHCTPDENLKLYYTTVAYTAGRHADALRMYASMIDEVSHGLRADTLISYADLQPDVTAEDLAHLSGYYASMGDILHDMGRADDSYTAYENAILLNSSNDMARNNYAYFLATSGGDLDKAEKMSSKTVLGSNNPTYLDTYAWILHLKGDNEQALKYQQKAISAAEKDDYLSAELYDHLGDIMWALGDTEQAIASWQKALELNESQQKSADSDDPHFTTLTDEHKAISDKITNANRNNK